MLKRFFAPLFLILFLTACHTEYHIQKSESTFYIPKNSGSNLPDSNMVAVSSPYKIKLDETMNKIVAKSEVAIEKGQPESRLGNLVADICFQRAVTFLPQSSDKKNIICVLNNGGLRSSLPKGEITLGNVYELMPFDNELVIVTITADSVYSLLRYIAEKGGVPVSNLQMKINAGNPDSVLIGGIEYDRNKEYSIITSDYLSNGGDAMSMFGSSMNVLSTGIKVRDAIIDFLIEDSKKNTYLKSGVDGRITK